eukprot:gene5465-6148_t
MKNINSLVTVFIFICQAVLYGSSVPIRLSGGRSKFQGDVEVFYNGSWQTVCDDNWDIRDAKVVCRQLGFSKALNFTTKGYFTKNSTKSYWLDDLYCFGHEKDIAHCWSRAWGKHNCKEFEEAGVICSDEPDKGVLKPIPSLASGDVTSMKIRLLSSDTKGYISHGYLEILHQGRWGAICADDWDDEDAYVACGQLGYPNFKNSSKKPSLKYKSVPYFWMTKFQCNGLESTLLQCDHGGWGPHKCLSKKPVYVHCQMSPMMRGDHMDIASLQAHDVRLRSGFRVSEGRVEVFHDNIWGTVCDDNWDITDANVVCRQAGFGTAFEALHWAQTGSGMGRIWMDEVECTGNEKDLRKCKHAGWHKSDCGHMEDAGVRCHHPFSQEPEVRLVGGPSKMIGRVEVKVKNKWYGVCGIGFTNRAAEIVCRELGLGYAKRGFSSASYGFAHRIAMSDIKCSGDENSLKDCHHAGYFRGGCRYYEMASVECSKTAPDLVMDFKYLEKSFLISNPILARLMCAYEEGCLSSSAGHYMYYPEMFTRRLLKFSAKFWNKGTDDFIPHVKKSAWQWHSCHQHYHSMERFADFDLLDKDGVKRAEGHKASFCLEDSSCSKGVKKVYNCTDKGDQGISVGCWDNYKNNIDCQWIDVSDVTGGEYTIRVNVNPRRSVPESDYANNAAICKIQFNSTSVTASNCSIENCIKRVHGGNSNGDCCVFPFIYKKKTYHSCTKDGLKTYWCSTTSNYDKDKRWGQC